MLVGLLGDVHGHADWTNYALKRLRNEGVTTVVQLGDFGVWPGTTGERFVNRVNVALTTFGMDLIVVPGNHEDYDQIERVQAESKGWIADRIFLAPRGHRGEFDGHEYVMLGGAPSVDRAFRLRRMDGGALKSWWGQEAITPDDVLATVNGGTAEFMFAHDAPFVPSIEANIKGNPYGFDPIDLDYALQGRRLMAEAVKGVEPEMFFHGHYHFPVRERIHFPSAGLGEPGKIATRDILFTTEVFGMDQQGTEYSFGILDTETKTVKRLTNQRAGYLAR